VTPSGEKYKAPILLDKSSIKHQKYARENILYSIKGQHKYKGSLLTNSQKDLDDNKRVLHLGVIGENVGISSTRKAIDRSESHSRKILKGNSLDMKLPRIGEAASQDRESLRNQNSIDNIKLPNLNKYNHGKYFVSNQRSGGSKHDNPINYRYKYQNKVSKDIYDSYIGNGQSKLKNKVINKLKMYQSNVKGISKDESGNKKSLTRKKNSKLATLNPDNEML
jgi:hypothetical protein